MINDHSTNADPLLSVVDAATYLGVSLRFVRSEIAARHVSAVRIGRLVKIRRSELERYIEARMTGPVQ